MTKLFGARFLMYRYFASGRDWNRSDQTPCRRRGAYDAHWSVVIQTLRGDCAAASASRCVSPVQSAYLSPAAGLQPAALLHRMVQSGIRFARRAVLPKRLRPVNADAGRGLVAYREASVLACGREATAVVGRTAGVAPDLLVCRVEFGSRLMKYVLVRDFLLGVCLVGHDGCERQF